MMERASNQIFKFRKKRKFATETTKNGAGIGSRPRSAIEPNYRRDPRQAKFALYSPAASFSQQTSEFACLSSVTSI